MARKPVNPPKRPKKPPKPMMRFARPAMTELISRLEMILDQDDDEEARELLQQARDWPRSALNLPKSEREQIKARAGELVHTFNRKFADRDGKGLVKFG